MKINEERTGLTTDDDAMSEMKVGINLGYYKHFDIY